jgi:hypothetical protein
MFAPRRRRLAVPMLLACATVLLLAIVTTATGRDPKLWPPPPGDAVEVFLVDNGAHSDLALPRAALGDGPAGRAAAMATAKPWVMIGYGDARFFIETGVSLGRGVDALRAMFAPGNPGALRFDGLSDAPDRLWNEGVTPVRISRAGLAAMTARIDRSVRLDADGRPIVQLSPPEPDSLFVRSRETFSALHLCNHWTAEALHAAGLPTTPVLDTLPAGLKFDLKMRAHAG